MTDGAPEGSVGEGGPDSTVVDGSRDAQPVLTPCPSPSFAPTNHTVASGTNIIITAAGLPAPPAGWIFFTTDGTLPSRMSPTYNAGAIGIPISMNTNFRAISSTLGATCADSPMVEADYVVTQPPPPEAGAPPAKPTFSATQTTQSNDFAVTLTSTPGATICYTLGATAPTCTMTATTAACGGGGTLQYTAAPIAINSSVTGTTGSVEIQAIACMAGSSGPSGVAMAQYTLQAAAPTMAPAPGPSTFSAALTGSFADTTSAAIIHYTSDGSAPTCTTGQTFTVPFALTTGTYNAIACKTGYVPSTVAGPFAITVNLTAPVLAPAAGTFNAATTVAANNTAVNPTGSWVCYSTTATAPVCGATINVCSSGSATAPSVADGNSVKAIACAPAGYTSSGVTTAGPYKLQLAAPFVNPEAANAAGSPTFASYMLPGTHPTGVVLGASIAAGVQAGGWLCWAEDPATASPPACDAANPPVAHCSSGTYAAGASYTLTAPQLAMIAAGDTLSVISCPNPSAPGAGAGFEPSAVTSLVFTGAGQAPPPSIGADNTANNALNYYQPVNATIVNTATSPMTVCYAVGATAPTCTPGSTAAGCKLLDGSTTQALTYTVTNGGAGYTAVPFVTNSLAGCAGASATATVAGGVVTGVTGTGTCSGLVVPPTIGLVLGSGLAATATVAQNISFTVTAAGTGYALPITIDLAGHVGTNAVNCTGAATTSVLATGGVTSIAATPAQLLAASCPLFTDTPTVTIHGGGTGAAATATVSATQAVAIALTAPGSHYTSIPGIVLTPASGGGSCTYAATFTATGAVATITASNCTGFTDPAPVVTVTDPTMTTQATAVAIGSNMLLVPTVQTSPTTVQAVACNAGLSTSPVASTTYTFQQPPPIVEFTPTSTGIPVVGAPQTITQAGTLSITTIGSIGFGSGTPTNSGFTDTTIVYSTDPLTVPNCTGTGTSVAGSSVTVPFPLPDTAARTNFTVQAIACGAGQTRSGNAPVTVGAFSINVAQPVIATTVGAKSLVTNPAGGTVTAQNVATATVTSATTGSYVCYTTSSGATPGCSTTAPGCTGTGVAKWTTFPATLPITTSGTDLKAVACATDKNGTSLDSSATAGGAGGDLYDLMITPSSLIASTATMTCPESITVGFDPTNTIPPTLGGPTTGATVCWSLASQPIGCGTATGVTCFAPTTGAPTSTISVPANAISTVFVTSCLAGFDVSTQQLTITPTTPYVPPTITVDGAVTDWTAKELVAGSVGTLHGGFTYVANATPPAVYAATPLLFESDGYSMAAGTHVVVFVGDGTTTNASTTGPVALGSPAVPFAAHLAYDVVAAGGTLANVYVFNTGTGLWTNNAAFVTGATIASVGAAFELSAPIAQLAPAGSTVNVAGIVEAGGTVSQWWPNVGSAVHFIKDGLQSCQTPASLVQ